MIHLDNEVSVLVFHLQWFLYPLTSLSPSSVTANNVKLKLIDIRIYPMQHRLFTFPVQQYYLTFQKKPSKQSNHYKRLRQWQNTQDSIKMKSVREFAVDISKGRPFITSISGAKSSAWREQHLFCLDYDNKNPNKIVSMDDEIKRFTDIGICPNIAYETYSSSAILQKFRLVWVTSGTKDKQKAIELINALNIYAGVTDDQTTNESNLFHGTFDKEVRVLSEVPTDIDLMADCIYALLPEKSRNTVAKIRKSQKEHNSRDPEEYFQELVGLSVDEVRRNKNSFEIDILPVLKETKLYEELMSSHQPRKIIFLWATNMHWLGGGKDWLIDTMLNLNDTGVSHYDDSDFEIVVNADSYPLLPQYFSNALEYGHPDRNSVNFICLCKFPIDKILFIEPVVKESYSSTHEKHKSFLNDALHEQDNSISVLKLCTGLGKSTLLSKTIDPLEHSAVIATPYHTLKDVMIKAIEDNHESKCAGVYSTNKLPKFSRKLTELLSEHKDNPDMVGNILHNIHVFTTDSQEKDRELVKEYLENEELVFNQEMLAVTTHDKALSNMHTYQQKLGIFDEDPLMKQISNIKISFDEVNTLIQAVKFIDVNLKNHLSGIIENECNERLIYRKWDINKKTLKALKNNKIISNYQIKTLKTICDNHVFLKLHEFSSNSYSINIPNYIKFPNDRPFMINSATVSLPIMKIIYGDRLKVLDISHVESKGKVLQCRDKSFSMTNFDKHFNDMIDDICERKQELYNDEMNIITFKDKKARFIDFYGFDNTESHFYYTCGHNDYEGKNIAVVGTPNFDQNQYKIMAESLGLDYDPNDRFARRLVKYNGKQFYFTTFKSEMLQLLHMSMIDAELIQAVGRARVLHHDCTVELYSIFPCSATDEYFTLKQKGDKK